MDKDFLTLIRAISEKLQQKDLKLSVAESCTGGFISHAITNFPGSSKFFDMSLVSYSNESKMTVLGISSSLLRKQGVVSEDAAIAMAKSVRKLAKTDVSLSVTGIAGPETYEGKEIGLIYMAVVTEDWVESKGMRLTGDREEIKKQAAYEALTYLKQVLKIWI